MKIEKKKNAVINAKPQRKIKWLGRSLTFFISKSNANVPESS